MFLSDLGQFTLPRLLGELERTLKTTVWTKGAKLGPVPRRVSSLELCELLIGQISHVGEISSSVGK